ncbi:MAG: secretin N-terminal domain-containing protein, partial [bacterium]|nr:secretin N-terminal domain-containing protein [bacterium]
GSGTPLPHETEIKIVADKGTNALIIHADPEDYEQIRELLDKLDIPRSQVLIEALFMEVRGSDSLILGVEWQTFGGEIGADNSIDKLGFGGSLTNEGALADVIGAINDENPAQLADSLGDGFNLGVFGNFIEVNGIQFPSISALVTAVSTRADTNILATPQILTIDNQEAEIKIGENRPFLTQARTGEQGVNDVFQSFDFRDVGLTLKVTPHISHNRFVRLELYQEISRVNEEATTGPGGTGSTAPVTTKRSAQTSVVVQDGHTIVIGGLIEDNVSDRETQVPCLGDLPLLGTLFRSVGNSVGKTNLMIFLTPRIITNPIEAANVSAEKHKDFRDYDRHESKEPEPTFYGTEEGQAPSKTQDVERTTTAAEETGSDANQEERQAAHSDGQWAPVVPSAAPQVQEVGETFIPPADENQAVATPESTSAAPAAAASHLSEPTGRFRVRTAVFFNTRALEQAKESLFEMGYAPYITTRTVMRNRPALRVGPLPDLSDYMRVLRDAEKNHLSVEKIEDGSELFAHVFSSGRNEGLEDFSTYWKREGFETTAITKGVPRKIYWLMAGAYDTWGDAEAARKSLLAHGIDAMIIERP